ncbi:phospholipase D-like protein [Homoserinimonas aerilata]|uniref:Phospholipase D-like protein n=1 Tax=Homoserinimonas aerilata TaxID=1162970 RepID=A0A542YA68_9MICO|nr:PLDc N-terminal domain-containing protein [Homoserinimonas aerilata]TQL44991.1 phospholipase D-like protein [Homoserinimonas aerilata]
MRAFLSLLLGALVLAFWVYTLIDCIRTDEYRARGLPKGVWVFVIIIIPVVGSILWLTIGKERDGGASAPARPAPTRPMYPDDDVDFLRRVETDAQREERIRKLEERLAELDDDSKNEPKD